MKQQVVLMDQFLIKPFIFDFFDELILKCRRLQIIPSFLLCLRHFSSRIAGATCFGFQDH